MKHTCMFEILKYTLHFLYNENHFITSYSNDLMKILSMYASNNVFNIDSKQVEAY